MAHRANKGGLTVQRLFLVRHARSAPSAHESAHVWKLSREGRAQAAELAACLRSEGITTVVTSEEPKAQETGRVLAHELAVLFRSAPGLHEQRRETVPFFGRPGDFQQAVERLFLLPAERVFGEESADEAHARFAAGLRRVITGKSGNVVVVSHGTVISLLVARANELDALALWRSLAMPDLLTLDWPDLQLAGRVTPAGATRSPG